VPPGFRAGAGEFAGPVGARRVQKFGVTARQVTLYLGDVRPGSAQAFEYTLRPKYPVKAKAPTAACECYTPANRATSRPVQLVAAGRRNSAATAALRARRGLLGLASTPTSATPSSNGWRRRPRGPGPLSGAHDMIR
jgi:hypothetical protein